MDLATTLKLASSVERRSSCCLILRGTEWTRKHTYTMYLSLPLAMVSRLSPDRYQAYPCGWFMHDRLISRRRSTNPAPRTFAPPYMPRFAARNCLVCSPSLPSAPRCQKHGLYLLRRGCLAFCSHRPSPVPGLHSQFNPCSTSEPFRLAQILPRFTILLAASFPSAIGSARLL